MTGRLLAVAPQFRLAPGHARGVVATAPGHTPDRSAPFGMPSVRALARVEELPQPSVEGCQIVMCRSGSEAPRAPAGIGTAAHARSRARLPRVLHRAGRVSSARRSRPGTAACCRSSCRSTVRSAPPAPRAISAVKAWTSAVELGSSGLSSGSAWFQTLDRANSRPVTGCRTRVARRGCKCVALGRRRSARRRRRDHAGLVGPGKRTAEHEQRRHCGERHDAEPAGGEDHADPGLFGIRGVNGPRQSAAGAVRHGVAARHSARSRTRRRSPAIHSRRSGPRATRGRSGAARGGCRPGSSRGPRPRSDRRHLSAARGTRSDSTARGRTVPERRRRCVVAEAGAVVDHEVVVRDGQGRAEDRVRQRQPPDELHVLTAGADALPAEVPADRGRAGTPHQAARVRSVRATHAHDVRLPSVAIPSSSLGRPCRARALISEQRRQLLIVPDRSCRRRCGPEQDGREHDEGG